MPRRRGEDDGFDDRLETEIITDAKPEELRIAWYAYLDDHLLHPFKARCVAQRLTSASRLDGGPPLTGSNVKRGVAAGRSAQRACSRSSDWRRGARRAPPTRNSCGRASRWLA
jgi:hypothetical protein